MNTSINIHVQPFTLTSHQDGETKETEIEDLRTVIVMLHSTTVYKDTCPTEFVPMCIEIGTDRALSVIEKAGE